MKKQQTQTGIALFIVIVLVLLSTLLALWAGRTAFFAGLIASNEADYQRAVEAAQAMLEEAKQDILINTTNSKANPTRNDGEDIIDNKESFSNFATAMSINKIDSNIKIYCKDGICLRIEKNLEYFWEDKNTLEKMIDIGGGGVRYGTYTNHQKDSNGNVITPNPILSRKGNKEGAWYWIEPIRFNSNNNAATLGGSNTPNTPVIYRITSIAFGLKGGNPNNFPINMAVLQSTIALPANSGEQVPE